MRPSLSKAMSETGFWLASPATSSSQRASLAKLLGTYLRTLAALDPKPDALVFYNGAVRLLGPGSAHLESLRQLEAAGVDLLACITCLEFFGLTQTLAAGQVSNMREIAQRTMAAAKVITI